MENKKSTTENKLPFVIYIFTITAFALELAEFVPIGITDVIAKGMNVSGEQVGIIVAAYALGATFSAPVLTAVTNSWSRKKTMLVTTIVFTLGSFVAAYANTITLMTIGRFIAGIGHGLFLAVASSTAAKLAGSKKAGTAVAVVFGGFTIAMAIGVPLSTYLGSVLDWRLVLSFIGIFGAIGFFGLVFGMKDILPSNPQLKINVKKEILTILHPKLLSGALVTIFAYAGSFAVYTYIAIILTNETHVSQENLPIYTLIYGIFAAIGNFVGGSLSDKLGINKANIYIILGIVLVTFGMTFFSNSETIMGILISLLGFFTFASVPALQARLIAIAGKYAPQSHSVAAGLNIAGFNSAIALGALIGGIIINSIGITYTGFVGGILSLIGLLILIIQIKKEK